MDLTFLFFVGIPHISIGGGYSFPDTFGGYSVGV